MKDFIGVTFAAGKCKRELEEFGRLLESNAKLEERSHIKPFFEENQQLAAMLGVFAQCGPANKLSYEFNIEGDFRADIAVGNGERRKYCMVEFEEGGPSSIFAQKNRSIKEWSRKFDHGFSQLIDWFYALDGLKHIPKFTTLFGDGHVEFYGLLVIGRVSGLSRDEPRRLRWRGDNVVVNNHKIRCITYDELYDELSVTLDQYLTQDRAGD